MTDAALQPPAFGSSDEHLAAELSWLELVLRQRVLDATARRSADEKFDEFAGMYVSDGEIARYVGDAEQLPPTDPRSRELADRIARMRQELDTRAAANASSGNELRLQRLSRRFRLTPNEQRVLVCCVAPDWELRFQRYFAYLQNDVARRRPTVQLLAELFGNGNVAVAARDMFSADAPLVREWLLTLTDAVDVPFPARQPVVPQAVCDYLAGAIRPDARLAGIASIRQPKPRWPPARWYQRHRDIAAALIKSVARDGRLPTAYIWGANGSSKGLVTRTVAGLAETRLLRADCRAWTAAGGCSTESLRLLRRDAIMHSCLIEIARCEALLEPAAAESRAAIETFLRENRSGGVMLTGTASIDQLAAQIKVPLWSFEIPRPDFSERADLWQAELAARGWQGDPALVDALSTGFRFTPQEIRRAIDESARAADGDALNCDALMRACRESSRRSITRFARRIVPRRGWDDLVLPEDSRTQLQEICAGARGRRRVHDEWGFGRKLTLGAGLNVLFAGPSGVGKTMSAEVLAGELGLDLFAVDLSCVVSKYIGETEKNLAIVFDEAESTNCVLFFDECDALFGKRTEIKDAHDRYANIEVSYLLQRIDQYDGIVILATNLRSNLDAAFTRRIRYAVEFPFPESQHREQIWRKVFPKETPVGDDVDLEFLARQFKLTGGSITNIAVNAAFLAASNGGCVGMKHLVHATRRELQKMGKSCTKADFGRYFSWVRDVGAAPVAAEAQ